MELIGQQVATQAANAGMGMLLGSINDRRQIRQGDRLLNQQIRANKEMADYNYQKQLDMWNATGYLAQKKQMEAAGLNPGMMYGMQGGGGQTTGQQGAQVTAQHAPTGGGEIQATMGMGMQLQLLDAQKKVLESQANLNNVEAAKKSGVDTRASEQQITESAGRLDKLKAETTNEQVRKEILEYEKANLHLQNYFLKETQEDRLREIQYNASIAFRKLGLLENDLIKSGSTLHDEIDIIRQNAIGAALHNELTQEGIQVQKAQVQKWAQEIAQGWSKLSQTEREVKAKEFEAELKAMYPGITNSAARIVNDAIESFFRATLGKPRPNMGQSVHDK